jgi:hypothetical protein
MSELPQEELLSAYLDGELDAQQKAEVEKLLAEDPSARATLESLREVSSAVKGLPGFELKENLADDVLKAAERRMLSEALPVTIPKPADELIVEPTWRTVARRFITPRAIIWSTTAAVIAILLTLHNPDADKPGPGGELAMDVKADRPVDDMDERGMGELSAARSAESFSAPADTEISSVAKKEFEAAEPSMEDIAKKGMPAPAAAKSIAKGAPPSFKSKSAPPMGKGGAIGGINGMGPGMPLADKDNQGQISRESGYNARSEKSWTGAKKQDSGPAAGSGQQIVTVRCNVESPATANRALERILLTQNFAPARQSSIVSQEMESQRARAKQFKSRMQESQIVWQQQAHRFDKLAEAANKVPKTELPAKKPSATQIEGLEREESVEPDTIFIEATQSQLEQVLVELRNQSKVFGKYLVDPGPMATQLGLSAVDSEAKPSVPAPQQFAPTGEDSDASAMAVQQRAPADMPSLSSRTANFNVVFLVQPAESKAATSTRAKPAEK